MSARLTAADLEAGVYDPQVNDYDLAADPRCLWGWGPPECRHKFGHACFRALGHTGMCGDDGLNCFRKRPKDWDSHGRAEANR